MEIITSRRNPLCMHIKKLGESRSYRYGNGEFLCDGLKLLEEAIGCGVYVSTVLTAEDIPFPLPNGVRVCSADRTLLDSLSPLKNAQSLLFVCRMPAIGNDVPVAKAVEETFFLLDGIQDPGNVGAIFRSALAFSISGLIMAGACADPYNPKTIRASMGAVFKQRFYTPDYSELEKLRADGAVFAGASPGASSNDISETSLTGKIIAIGSEGCGLSDEIQALCSENVKIPIASGCESLNAAVAASILMWEATQKCRL